MYSMQHDPSFQRSYDKCYIQTKALQDNCASHEWSPYTKLYCYIINPMQKGVRQRNDNKWTNTQIITSVIATVN